MLGKPIVVTDNSAQVSQIIDTLGFGSLTFAIETGTLSDADTTVVALVEDGDAANLSDAAAVDDKELIGTELLAGFQFDDDNEPRKIGYVGHKRYVRLTLTPSWSQSFHRMDLSRRQSLQEGLAAMP